MNAAGPWIPVSERLPEAQLDEVLIRMRAGNHHVASYHSHNGAPGEFFVDDIGYVAPAFWAPLTPPEVSP